MPGREDLLQSGPFMSQDQLMQGTEWGQSTPQPGWDPTGLGAKIDHLNQGIDNFTYWVNPVHWFTELWGWIDRSISGGALDAPFIAGTIILIWVAIIGAKWAKKWLLWGWIVFWALRGFVFNGH